MRLITIFRDVQNRVLPGLKTGSFTQGGNRQLCTRTKLLRNKSIAFELFVGIMIARERQEMQLAET